MSEANLLTIEDLAVDLTVDGHPRRVVQCVSLTLAPGGALGIVGESGSGKSVTARSVLRLLPHGARVSGRLEYDGKSITDMSAKELRRFRSSEIAMIYQDPRAHINPVRTIGDFLTEGVPDLTKAERRSASISALNDVGIPDAERRLQQYPHQLSGGLLQRVMIAAAIMPGPRLILADEPTTALDVTTQSEVMAVLNEQRVGRGLAMVFITHDLDLAAAVTDRLAVMYAGVVVETGPTDAVRERALHPYTVGLMASQPRLERAQRLYTIPGRPVAAYETGEGCVFTSRCEFATDICRSTMPEPEAIDGTVVRCHRARELRGQLSQVREAAL